MKLDYGTLLCPDPIKLSIGTLRQPTLREIRNLSFEKFGAYELFLKITPEEYYTKFLKADDKWDSFTLQQQVEMTMYDVLLTDKGLKDTYLEIFSFFFEEEIIFTEGIFVLLNSSYNKTDKKEEGLTKDDVSGVITQDNFKEALEVIQQICHIYDGDKVDEEKNNRYKNKLAEKLLKRMKQGKKEQEEANRKKSKRQNKNMQIENIISAVSNRHPTLSPLTIWDATIFILLDCFERLQVNEDYEMIKHQVCVWGDEKKVFKRDLWYQNNYN